MCGIYVESCLRLDVYDILDGDAARRGSQTGTLEWRWSTGEAHSSVGFLLRWPSPIRGELLLAYSDSPKTPEPVRLRIDLSRTRPGFGGLRWWFHCPIGDSEGNCERRVKTLLLPPYGLVFGCRACHGLHYRSQYEVGYGSLRRGAMGLAAS